MGSLFQLIKSTPSILRAPTNSARFRLSLIALGPLYVKFGQTLSTRRDLLPPALADELVKLQDEVPAFSFKEAKNIVEKNLAQPLDVLFAQFDETPLGSASIAQVHGARLHSGEEVVVKILRPHIEKRVTKDIRLLAVFISLLEIFSKDARKLDLKNALNEFKKITAHELDLNYEVANASQLKRNMKNLSWVTIPEVYWPYTRKNIAVFSRIHATPIRDKDALIAQNIDLTLLAQRSLELFFTAVFEHNFFHADMHPGNIFVKNSDAGLQYILVDFGIMGTLPLEDQRYLAENLTAFLQRDYSRVAQLHIASGWVGPNTRQDAFANAIRTVCEPIFSRAVHEISFAELFMRLLETARTFDMVILPQMILLQKTLMNIEGLARYLDPHIDIWEAAKPSLDRHFKQRTSFKNLRAQLRDAPLWFSRVLQLPNLATQTLSRFNHYQQQIPALKTAKYKSFITGFICAALIGVFVFLNVY